jgi:hypothetical protein
MKEKKIISSIAYREIQSYLREQAISVKGNTYTLSKGTTVQIQPGGIQKLGKLEWPLTNVSFRGDEEDCLKAVAAFRRQFLSAGG